MFLNEYEWKIENGKSKKKLNKNEKKSIKCDILLMRNKIFICLCLWKVIPTALHRILCACWWSDWSDGVSPWLLVSSLTPDFELCPTPPLPHRRFIRIRTIATTCYATLVYFYTLCSRKCRFNGLSFFNALLQFHFISYNKHRRQKTNKELNEKK